MIPWLGIEYIQWRFDRRADLSYLFCLTTVFQWSRWPMPATDHDELVCCMLNNRPYTDYNNLLTKAGICDTN